MSLGAAVSVEPQRPTRRPVGVTLIVLCQSMQALALGGIGLFLPLIRTDLGLSFAQAGSLGAASSAVYALMQIPSGWLADRIGPRRLFLLGLVGTNVMTVGFALLHRYALLVANQAVSGFFRSLVFAPGLLLVSALFPPQRRATAMGLYIAGGFSSNIFLNSLGPKLVGPVGWRHLFEIFAGAGFVVFAAYWRFGPSAPLRAAGPAIPFRQALGLFRHRAMWLLGVIQFARLAAVLGLAYWLPTFIVDERHHSLEVAGLVTALGAAVTAPSNFLGGYVSDRIGRPLLVIGTSLTMIAATTALLPHTHPLVLLIVLIAVNSIFIQLYFGPLFAVGVELFGQRRAGLASGFGNFFANVGGFAAIYGIGALRDATGSFTLGFSILAGLCVAALAAAALVAREAPVET